MTNQAVQHTCVFGMGWGDEGKGKLVDLLSPAFQAVVRFNGGANAGHTVCVGQDKFALHLLPTGVLHDNAVGVIGPGVVVDPIGLLEEIDNLADRGVQVIPKLKISHRAHLVMPYHKAEDKLSETSATGTTRIGTTARGIGPCYADKMRRTTAIRFIDIINDPQIADRVRELAEKRSTALSAIYGDNGGLDIEAIVRDVLIAKERLSPIICDTTKFLYETMDAGQAILFEGANGMLLDVDHGTYPFVTSSATGPHGIGSGAGVPPASVSRYIGVIKAYSTRVGSGPFVTELKDDIGDRIRKQGNEFGTTTGRPRRCGWFDAIASRYARQVAGATDIAIMHLDTLSGFDQVGVCIAYRCDGQTLTTMPADAATLQRCEPVIEYRPGWHENLRSVRRYEDLPQTARNYVEHIETLVGAPVSILGVGPDRSQTLLRGDMKDCIDVPEPASL